MFRRSSILLPALALMLGCEATTVAPDSLDVEVAFSQSPAPVQTVNIVDEFGTGAGVAGTATLRRTQDGLWVDVHATGVVAGDAYTLWFVIFDNAKGCGKDGCGLDDLGTRQAQVTLANAGGAVASGTNHTFVGHADRHDLGGKSLLLGDPRGVDNTYKSELHVILRRHGLAEMDDARKLADQLSMVLASCNLLIIDPEEDDGCSDDGVMIFAPAGPPGNN